MTLLAWSPALALDLPEMDDTHREFVDLLAAVVQCDDTGLLGAWERLIAHTDDHFGREDDWMRRTGFSSSNCHSTQHAVVLQVMREGLRRGQVNADLALVRQMADELGTWFPQHAQTMDAALALHLRGIGFDPASGAVRLPQALPAAEMHGCGGASCSPAAPVSAAPEPAVVAA